MSEFNNGLSKAEAEILAIAAEEMGEALQLIGKSLRHGLKSYNPLREHDGSNKKMLSRECGDVLYAIHMMLEYEIIERFHVFDKMEKKGKNIGKYLHHCFPIYPSEMEHINLMSATALAKAKGEVT